MPLSLAKMRRQYTLDGLDEVQAPDDPMALFALWMQQARDTESPPVEANAMALATVDEQGRPHCRVLLLKGFDAQGFSFFGNYDSAKGQNLAANPWAAMTFFLAGFGAASPHRRAGRQTRSGVIGCLFRIPFRRQSPGCLGLATKPTTGGQGCARVLADANRKTLCRSTRAAPRPLGRLLPAARTDGVLARPRRPFARSPRLPPARRRLAAQSPGALSAEGGTSKEE